MDTKSFQLTGAHSHHSQQLNQDSQVGGGGSDVSSSSSSHEPATSSVEKRPNLRLQIPPRSFDDLYGKPPLSPSSAKSSSKARVARPSFKSRVSTPPPVSGHCSSSSSARPQQQQQGLHNGELQQVSSPSGSGSGSFSSLAKMFSPAARRTSSLPVTPIADAVLACQEQEPVDETMSEKLLAAKFERSLSVPLKKSRSLKKSNGVIMLVKPATPPAELSKESPKTTPSPKGEEHGQEIPAEQAVCRICMDELGEGGNTFQMECSCKGELALAHEECALKWFGIKGNKTCDVCGKEVQNLPVMLLRLSNDGTVSRQQQSQISRFEGRLWQDIPVLIMISMLAYFCLLEQLLVGDLGSGALVIALPFACVLGLLASITASTLVSRKFIWGYAALQFGLVILFAHVFYNVVHVEAVLSILLSAFAGFGIAMGVNGLCLEYSSWQRRHQQERQHQQLESGQQSGQEHMDIELGHPPNG